MKKHILVIDDEESIREMLRQILTAKGYRVSAVATGLEAHRAAQADPPQLITVDLQMEDTDGLELIRQLKSVVPGVPVILLTGVLFDPQVVRQMVGNQISSYLQKTTSLKQIIQEIQRLLGEPGAAKTP